MSSIPTPFVFPNGQPFASSAMSQKDVQAMFQQLVMQMLNITVDPQNEDAAYRQVRCGYQQDGQPAWNTDEDVAFVIATPEESQYGDSRDQTLSLTAPFTASATLTNGSKKIMVNPPWGIVAGQIVSGYGIPSNTFVESAPPNSFEIGISNAATVDAPTSLLTFTSVALTQNLLANQKWNIKLVFYGPNALRRADLVASAFILDWPNAFLGNPPQPYTSAFFIVSKYRRPKYVADPFQRQWWNRYDVNLAFYEEILQSSSVPVADSVDVTVKTSQGLTEETTISVA